MTAAAAAAVHPIAVWYVARTKAYDRMRGVGVGTDLSYNIIQIHQTINDTPSMIIQRSGAPGHACMLAIDVRQKIRSPESRKRYLMWHSALEKREGIITPLPSWTPPLL